MSHVSDTDKTSFQNVLNDLMQAWNAGDGDGFAACMAEDADFVTIRADHLHGQWEIAASHRHIFETIYAGSRNDMTLEAARILGEGMALIHASCVLDSPSGPLAGRRKARFSAVLLHEGERWAITSFHITLAPSPG